MSEKSAFLPVGRLGKTKGLKGHLYVDLYNPASEVFSYVKCVFLADREFAYNIEEISQQSQRWVIKLEGVSSVDIAKALTGKEFLVERKNLPPLKVGEFYVSDVVGFEVVDLNGQSLGSLKAVFPTASKDVYVVEGAHGEVLLPTFPGVVVRTDLEAKKIFVNPPETIDAF